MEGEGNIKAVPVGGFDFESSSLGAHLRGVGKVYHRRVIVPWALPETSFFWFVVLSAHTHPRSVLLFGVLKTFIDMV